MIKQIPSVGVRFDVGSFGGESLFVWQEDSDDKTFERSFFGRDEEAGVEKLEITPFPLIQMEFCR